jgi:hypothetical protein
VPNGSFTSLKVTKTTCGKGAKLATAFHACRTKTGPTGRCVRLVKGYACREQRTIVGPTIDAKVSCAKGKKKKRKLVSFGYQQTG